MKFEMKLPILGFEDITEVEFEKVDDVVAKITVIDNPSITFTLINPYSLREYSFDLPKSAEILLDLKDDSEVFVYNIIAVGKPYDTSLVNFLAPIVLNQTNKTAGQIVLEEASHPGFGYAERISSFLVA